LPISGHLKLVYKIRRHCRHFYQDKIRNGLANVLRLRKNDFSARRLIPEIQLRGLTIVRLSRYESILYGIGNIHLLTRDRSTTEITLQEATDRSFARQINN